MPASEKRPARSGRLPNVLFWVGAALAPAAGLVVWFAHGGGPLRAAAILAILGTVLIGLSVVLRRSPEEIRLDLRAELSAENEALCAELRDSMLTALQRTREPVQEQIADLQKQVAALSRRRTEIIRTDAPSPRRAQPVASGERSSRFEPRRTRSHRHRAED